MGLAPADAEGGAPPGDEEGSGVLTWILKSLGARPLRQSHAKECSTTQRRGRQGKTDCTFWADDNFDPGAGGPTDARAAVGNDRRRRFRPREEDGFEPEKESLHGGQQEPHRVGQIACVFLALPLILLAGRFSLHIVSPMIAVTTTESQIIETT